MDDAELMKMAAFKLGEAASRLQALARTAHAVEVQRLLAAAARLLAAQQEHLCCWTRARSFREGGELTYEMPPGA
jgi:hypothetical protein